MARARTAIFSERDVCSGSVQDVTDSRRARVESERRGRRMVTLGSQSKKLQNNSERP